MRAFCRIRRPWGACWTVSVTERHPLFFSLTAQKRGGGGRAGAGGVGGYPVPTSLQAPPPTPSPTTELQNDEIGVFGQVQGLKPQPQLPQPQAPKGPGPKHWPAKALEAPVLEAPSPRPQAWHLGRHFLRRSASIQNTAVITAQAPARICPAPGPPFFATIRVHPKYGRHNCAGARTDTPGIWTGKNIHNPTATKNYVSTKLPRLESATPTATRQYVFADEVPHPHGTDIASTAYDDRRDLAADPFFAASLRPYSFYACWSRRSYDPRASTPAITRKHTRPLILLRRGLPWPIRLISAPTKLPHQNAENRAEK